MEITISDIISILTLLLGGGGIGVFFTWQYSKRKEKAEAEQAETTAAKEMQDMYQQLIEDVKKDRQDQREYIEELKSDRDHYREERNSLRERLDQTDEKIRELEGIVARYGRQLAAMRPLMCANMGCTMRQIVPFWEGDNDEKKTSKEI